MKIKILIQIILFVLSILPQKGISDSQSFKEIAFLSINSAITPASFDYLKYNFESLPESSVIVLKLNTPGGLISTTKDIITLVGKSKRVFVVWVTPEGASAASAGAIIASSAHFIFMSPGTNLGAATPVGLGGDIKENDGRRKAMNDLNSLIRSLNNLRNRPNEPFEKMVTKAESFTAEEAMKLGIIDGVISKDEDLIQFLTSKKINLEGNEVQLNTEGVVFKEFPPSLGQRILEVLANPSTAYILFLIGVALLYFEFQAPGGYISGAIGICLLLLAGISFQILPLDWGSMGLIIAGIFLLILEIFVISYGILTIAGLAAFVTGSLFLFHGESGFISIEYPIIFSALAGVILSLGFLLWYMYNDSKKQNISNNFFLPEGSDGRVLKKTSSSEYQVKVRGEIWKAISNEDLNVDDKVEIVSADPKSLTLNIKKK